METWRIPLIAVGRPQDAEQAARHAISLDDSYGRGHYLLGNILAKRVKPGSLAAAPEAALQLRKGASEMPHAHIAIATTLFDGRRQRERGGGTTLIFEIGPSTVPGGCGTLAGGPDAPLKQWPLKSKNLRGLSDGGGLFARVLHEQVDAEQRLRVAPAPTADLPFRT